jgi:hypothetical protein
MPDGARPRGVADGGGHADVEHRRRGVTRMLEAARGFEVTFWRSAFNALALVVLLGWMRGPGCAVAATLRSGGRRCGCRPVLDA